MLTNYYTLAYIVSTLAPKLAGSAIIESFSQEKSQMVLQFTDIEASLIISCDRLINTLYLHPRFERARANSVDVLGKSLGDPIDSVEMHSVDRVVTLKLKSGLRMEASFFGAKSNVILADESGKIVDAFKESKMFVGTSCSYRTGEILYDIEALRQRLSKPQLATFATVLREEFPVLGATLVKEILHRAEIPAAVGAMSVSEREIQAIQIALTSVLRDITEPKPRVYVQDTKEGKKPSQLFSLIPLLHVRNATEYSFDDVHEAIRFFIAKYRSHQSVDELKSSMIGKLSQKVAKARRTIDAIESDLQVNSRAEEYQRFGNLLMSHLHQLRSGGDNAVLNDTEGEASIPLVKDLSPVQNAQRYFEKAKRSRTAQHQATERLAELRRSIVPAERVLRLLQDVQTREDMKKFIKENKEELESLGISEKGRQPEQLPFRIFKVDGGFEVWAGKSSRNNDQLTMKYAKPNDLWFHARGAAGSHVILKVASGKGEPGKKAKEQAASIAAYYSKMKNAKLVPVAMTEKKFVRKPKGAAPGSVTIEREKVLFAEPALPREKTDN